MITERRNEAVYIKRKNGWFWVQWNGQQSLYYGPYKSREDAERYKDKPKGKKK